MTRAAVLLALVGAVLLAALGGGGSALAHPLGNFTINRYARIEVYSDAIRLHYILDEAEIPSFQLVAEIDTNGDGQLSDAELAAYALQARDSLAKSFSLTVNGQVLDLAPVEQSAQRLPGQGGLETTRIAIVYQAPVHTTGNATIAFVDHNFEDRAGWKEVVVRSSAGAQLTVDPALTVDQSDALRSYPAETLRSAPDVRSVGFQWTAGSGEPAPLVAAPEAAQ